MLSEANNKGHSQYFILWILEKQHSCFYKSNLATILLDFPVTIKMEILLKSPEHHTCEEYLAGCFARFAKFLMQAAIVLF